MTTQYRRTSPITDAVYGRKRKPQQPTAPKREVDPRRSFDIAGQLDQDTRNKLAALAGRAAKPKRRRRKGAK